jgi:heme A synthase
MSSPSSVGLPDPLRGLKRMTVLNLVLLSFQAWTGDVVNLFAAFPSGQVSGVGGAVQGLESAGPGPLALFHGIEGVLIVFLAIGIAAVALRRSKSRGVRVAGLLALLFIVVAALGGYLFLFSGFADNGNSAQMGGSFIGAYAMNFLVLYYSK